MKVKTKKCPNCGSDFSFMLYSMKTGDFTEACCVQQDLAKYGLKNNGCTFTCSAVRMKDGTIEIEYDDDDEQLHSKSFPMEYYLYKIPNICIKRRIRKGR